MEVKSGRVYRQTWSSYMSNRSIRLLIISFIITVIPMAIKGWFFVDWQWWAITMPTCILMAIVDVLLFPTKEETNKE